MASGVLSRNTHYCSSRWQDTIAQKALFRTSCLSLLSKSQLTSLGQEMRSTEYCPCSALSVMKAEGLTSHFGDRLLPPLEP